MTAVEVFELVKTLLRTRGRHAVMKGFNPEHREVLQYTDNTVAIVSSGKSAPGGFDIWFVEGFAADEESDAPFLRLHRGSLVFNETECSRQAVKHIQSLVLLDKLADHG